MEVELAVIWAKRGGEGFGKVDDQLLTGSPVCNLSEVDVGRGLQKGNEGLINGCDEAVGL